MPMAQPNFEFYDLKPSLADFYREVIAGLHARPRWIAQIVGPGGRLLVGVDLKKDEARLNAAYNDPEGITAAFNKNLLVRMQRELGASIELDAFAHRAFYNPDRGRIEMHLVATHATRIALDGEAFEFAEGDGIHTECSYKYRVEEFAALAG